MLVTANDIIIISSSSNSNSNSTFSYLTNRGDLQSGVGMSKLRILTSAVVLTLRIVQICFLIAMIMVVYQGRRVCHCLIILLNRILVLVRPEKMLILRFLKRKNIQREMWVWVNGQRWLWSLPKITATMTTIWMIINCFISLRRHIRLVMDRSNDMRDVRRVIIIVGVGMDGV